MLFIKKPAEASADRRQSAGQAAARDQVASPTQSVIDAWLTITGNLESQGDVRVEGQVSGDIRCANLIVGRDASISGDIVAEEAVVRGKVRGTIRANRVILEDTACVESAIYHKVLSIDEGASFDGQSCHRQQPHHDEDEASVQMVGPQRDRPTNEPFDRSNGPVAGVGLHSADA